MKIISTFIIILFSCLYSKDSVVILELNPLGMTDTEGNILTQRLTSEIINTDVFSILEQSDVGKLLKEKGYGNEKCIDIMCAVEIGNIINVHFVILGVASRFDSTYTLDIKRIEVANGKIAATSFFMGKNSHELMDIGIKSVAKKLTGIEKINTSFIQSGRLPIETNSPGIKIESTPPGADIFIGGAHFDKTPREISYFPKGRYEVVLKLDGYEDYKQKVKIKLNSELYINAVLKQLNYGYLDINLFDTDLYPLPAKVFIDGDTTISPLPSTLGLEEYQTRYKLVHGNHDITVKYPFYKTKKNNILINNDEYVELDFFLEKKSPKTTKRFAWIYPGLGHIYADQPERGQLWFFFATASLYLTNSAYIKLTEDISNYNKAHYDYIEARDDIKEKRDIRDKMFENKQTSLTNFSVTGAVSLGIWIWNILDVKNAIPDDLPEPFEFDFGINNTGQIEIRYVF